MWALGAMGIDKTLGFAMGNKNTNLEFKNINCVIELHFRNKEEFTGK